MKIEQLRTRIYRLLEDPIEDGSERWVRLSIQALIVLNVSAVVVQTVDPWGQRYADEFLAFELFSIAVFSVEYIFRIWAVTVNPRYGHWLTGRLRFALTPMALVDFLAIAPAWMPLLVGMDLRAMRVLRLLRIFRLLKLGRYSRALQSLGRALTAKLPELSVTVFALLIVLVMAASILYAVERDAQPDTFGSIPAAAWWGITTLTTVGYGDAAPITALGKFAASVVAILGIGLFALPAGILGSAFVSQLQSETTRCPHCGEVLDEPR